MVTLGEVRRVKNAQARQDNREVGASIGRPTGNITLIAFYACYMIKSVARFLIDSKPVLICACDGCQMDKRKLYG